MLVGAPWGGNLAGRVRAPGSSLCGRSVSTRRHLVFVDDQEELLPDEAPGHRKRQVDAKARLSADAPTLLGLLRETAVVDHDSVPSRTRLLFLAVLPWLGLPAAGAVWAAWRLRKMYFFYDEWRMIYISSHLGAIDGMTESFNSHLFVVIYWLYRIQISLFGVDSRFFISACFVIAIVALHLAIASVLRACDVPRQLSLMIGGLLAYLGCASQNFTFAFQISFVLSMAVGLFGATIVLRNGSSLRAIIATALCLVASSISASSLGVGLVAFVAVIAVFRWKWAAAAYSVTPDTIVLIWWFATADLGPEFPAPFGDRVSFAGRLSLQSIGAVVGNGQVAGAMVSGVATTLIVVAVVRRWLDQRAFVTMIAGLTSALVMMAAITQSRAGFPGFNFVDFHRYLSYVAIPLTLAAAAPLLAAVRHIPFGRHTSRLVPALPVGVVGIAFLLGLPTASSYHEVFQHWNVQTHHDVIAATVVIGNGCPSGSAPDPASLPTTYNPQINTQLLRELVDRGALSVGSTVDADAAVTAKMCPEP